MAKPRFVYVSYIATTPEKLWAALTGAEFTQQYWFGRYVESDWRPGSPVTYWTDKSRNQLDITGEVLRSEPPRLLSYTFTDCLTEEAKRERPSRVTFEIEPLGAVVKLTMTHDDFDPGSQVLEGVSRGWPGILSSLKSLLESDKPLVLDVAHFECAD
ncbi:MAG: SRPBCC family protein [Gammaproteobacteria bacterium]